MTDYVAIIVPSTRRITEPLSAAEAREYVQRTKRFLAEKFGGATAIPSEGAWITSDGLLVEENTTLVFAFTESLSDENKEAVFQFCEQLRDDLEQGAVLAIINWEPHFIT